MPVLSNNSMHNLPAAAYCIVGYMENPTKRPTTLHLDTGHTQMDPTHLHAALTDWHGKPCTLLMQLCHCPVRAAKCNCTVRSKCNANMSMCPNALHLLSTAVFQIVPQFNALHCLGLLPGGNIVSAALLMLCA